MQSCKFCGLKDLVKNGFVKNLQRFFCKSCCKNQIEKDDRKKYETRIKKFAIILYLEGNGTRFIARTIKKVFNTEVSFQLVDYWVKHAGQIIEEEILSKSTSHSPRIKTTNLSKIKDYLKTCEDKSEIGLLLTKNGSTLLILN